MVVGLCVCGVGEGGSEWEQWCTYKQKAVESHYLKVIRKSPKGQWWTCNAEGIMWAIISEVIIANSKKGAAYSEYKSHADKGKIHSGNPKYSNYSRRCGRKRQRATCQRSQMAFDNGFFAPAAPSPSKPKRHC